MYENKLTSKIIYGIDILIDGKLINFERSKFVFGQIFRSSHQRPPATLLKK